MSFSEAYDVIVVGAGHAGCEAALACARMGLATLCLCIDLDSVATMPCNPSIGGTSKGHLVREVDALGGEMGLAADECFIQMRMLNTSKGPAVHSLRAQMDKRRYHERMKLTLETQERLTLRQDECAYIVEKNGVICGIVTASGAEYACRAAVVASGVYLNSRIHIGEYNRSQGPCGMMNAQLLSKSLKELGHELQRFKTGTPPRVLRRSLDLTRMEIQCGDVPPPNFSFMSVNADRVQEPCYLTYTNAATHEVILANIARSPMYSGSITATGTRYCPSIEDKLVRFADKPRHQLFIEPEGLSTQEMYVQGLSTSLPRDVQESMVRTVAGMENCVIMRYGYAIEYDCIYPTDLNPYMMSKRVGGLFFAGQICGSSGYEEAAAQGLYAGINAALYVRGEEPLYIGRSDAYLGVLADDLTVKGTNEPYRMMTGRAEYRLVLRQDNADLRLTEKALRTGLISDERRRRLEQKRKNISRVINAVGRSVPADDALNALLERHGMPSVSGSVKLGSLLRRGGIGYVELAALYDFLPKVDAESAREAEIELYYGGYIEKQNEQIRRAQKLEGAALPKELDYLAVSGLRIEAAQKLSAQRPSTLGQASRISGVSPADIAVLLVLLKKQGE